MPAWTAPVNDSNRPQPLWQPPPTACLTVSRAVSEVPSLLTHPWGGGKAGKGMHHCISGPYSPAPGGHKTTRFFPKPDKPQGPTASTAYVRRCSDVVQQRGRRFAHNSDARLDCCCRAVRALSPPVLQRTPTCPSHGLGRTARRCARYAHNTTRAKRTTCPVEEVGRAGDSRAGAYDAGAEVQGQCCVPFSGPLTQGGRPRTGPVAARPPAQD